MVASVQVSSNFLQQTQRLSVYSSSSGGPSFSSALSAAGQNDTADSTRSVLRTTGVSGNTILAAQLSGDDYSAQTLKADYQSWKDKYTHRDISDDRIQEVNGQSDAYTALLDKAAGQNALADPQAFIKSLSSSELQTLQTIHCLADPIKPDTLSSEGAANLILPPNRSVDTDQDGFNMVGIAKTWQFPPTDAPDSVKQAWEETTAGLSGSDIMLLTGSLMPISIDEMTDQNSAYLGPDGDYGQLVSQTLANVRESSKYDESWQHETRTKQIDLLETLLGNLHDVGAA